VCGVLVLAWSNNGPVNPETSFCEQLLWLPFVLPGLEWLCGQRDLPTFSSPGLPAVGCGWAASPCPPAAPPASWGISTPASRWRDLAWRTIDHLGRTRWALGYLRVGRRTICQELHGYGCISLRAGEWESLKDFESQSFSTLLWFCNNQRLFQWQLFSFTWIRARIYLLLLNNISPWIAFSRTKGSTRYCSVWNKSHSAVLQWLQSYSGILTIPFLNRFLKCCLSAQNEMFLNFALPFSLSLTWFHSSHSFVHQDFNRQNCLLFPMCINQTTTEKQ